MLDEQFRSPSTKKVVRAVMFDTFGSVVDWRRGIAEAVESTAERLGLDLDPHAFADAWRSRYQPSMQPIRDGLRPFTPLDQLHRENLIATLEEFDLAVPAAEIEPLNKAWERLPPWPDSRPGLQMLKSRFVIGPLSNGNTALLVRMAKWGRLPWDVVIGADATGQYKPRPEPYLRTASILRIEPGELMLAAAHNDDLAAAREAGLATAFVARPREYGPHQTSDLRPLADWDVAAVSIVELAQQLGCTDARDGSRRSSEGS